MTRLPAEEAQRLARGNKRITVRYRCAPATAGKLFVSSDDHECQLAWIMNVSKTGVGLTLNRSVPQGAFVILQIRGADRSFHEFSAQIAHATAINQSEWLVGCELVTPLTDDELDSLL